MAVAAGWVAALVPGAWEDERVVIVLVSALAATALRQWRRARGRERRDRALAACAAVAFSLVVALTAAVRLVEPTVAQDWTLAAYELVLSGIAVGLAVGVVRARSGAMVTDLVVELAERPSGAQELALARALDDPSLELGYWLDDEQAYVDSTGRRVEVPGSDAARAVTRVDRDGERMAVLVHDPVVLDEPGLVAAVRASAGMTAANARLHAEVREQSAAVVASRLRLLLARDEERRRLELRLRDGAERRLVELRPALEAARRGATADTAVRVERALDRLDATLADLHELAAGLHPRELTERGLRAALPALASRSPTPVRLAVSVEPLSAEIETAIYFVCSEALANVAKYASASSVELAVETGDGVVRVDVRDDGVGGADPAAGSGLAGLADRVAALGGTLRVESPVGSGTRLHAELPLPGVSA
jgi:signal transduction histidine kinase